MKYYFGIQIFLEWMLPRNHIIIQILLLILGFLELIYFKKSSSQNPKIQ